MTDGLEEVLASSLNVRNRASKREKFCFATSEDAATWTVFRWLADTRGLSLVLTAAGLDKPEGDAELLLWGAPVRGGSAVHDELVSVCDELGEDSQRRSEPDVMIAWPRDLVFVEVKYQAPNDVKLGYGNFSLYTGRADIFALNAEQVAAAGYYELVRNWRVGIGVAERTSRSFGLINLGPRGLSLRTPDLAGTFRMAPGRAFASLSWEDLLATATDNLEVPPWFTNFVHERELDGRWG